MKKILFLTCAFVLYSSLLNAKTYEVDEVKIFRSTLKSSTSSSENKKEWNVANNRELREALEGASLNGMNDVILLSKGIYNTTADNLGTFIFNDNESFTLTIKAKKGLSSNEVVISGTDSKNSFVGTQVFNLKNASVGDFIIEGVSISDGKFSLSGAGIYSNQNVKIINSRIYNNISTGDGGGVYSLKSLNIENTELFSNISTTMNGGGLYAKHIIIKNSEVHGNISSINKGGGFYSENTAVITRSIFRNNESGDLGGGFFCNGDTILKKSKFIENKADRAGAGFSFSGSAIVTNSVFYKNNTSRNSDTYPSGVIISPYAVASYLYAINNNFIGSNGGVEYKGVLINNIFANNKYDISSTGDSYLYNNYISSFKINDSRNKIIKKNNIQFGSVGDIYLGSDNKTLEKQSPLIDKGMNPNSVIFKKAIENIDNNNIYNKILEVMETDIDDKERVSNGEIDIGSFEYNESNNQDNHPPVANTDNIITEKSTAITIDVLKNDSDQDGDNLTIESFDEFSKELGSIIRSENKLFYTPKDNFAGSDSFSYVVSDGRNGKNTGQVLITVQENSEGNHSPVAKNDSCDVKKNTSIIIDVLKNDTDKDGDVLSIKSFDSTSESLGRILTVVDNKGVPNGKLSYTPKSNFIGDDSFKYVVTDGKGKSSTGTVFLNVKKDGGGSFSLLNIFFLLLLILGLRVIKKKA